MAVRREKILSELDVLRAAYPDAGALHVGTPYHVIVMVVLSARTRDEQILRLAPAFFARFPTVQSLAHAELSDIVAHVKTVGMYQQKAKHLHALAQKILDEFGGEIPKTLDELVRLPGVGRKTASVVLAACFGVPAIAVDTHVHRVANRLGWVKTKTPAATERALLSVIPPRAHHVVNEVFVPFGRTVCTPNPRCFLCPFRDECPFQQKNMLAPKDVERILERISRSVQGIRDLKAALARAIA